ncbi:lysine histidine transporter-like 8 [Bidens hawaiensis]|uniref:lysine histidine transporter-like 8 n=1 Tax=Bidens hawaiensis TaxID=980011 RepID=UPI0040496457
MRDRTDRVHSNPITPSSVHSPPSSVLSSQLHSPSLSRSPLLHSPEHPQATSSTTKPKTGHKITFSHTPPVVSAPPSQMHSPFMGTPDRPVTMPPSGARTPMAYIRSRNLTPRFLTPLGSPLRKALHLTKLDPTDAWLPITESRNGNAYYAAFHTLCSGIGIQALVLPVAFTILGWSWGVIALTLAFIWQLYTLYLLVNLHESPETGMRYSRYMQLANAAFGERLGKLLALFPIIYLSAGTCVALIIIGGSTSKICFQVVCAANECKAETLTTVEWYLVFTCGAVLLYQLPNLNSIAGVSLVGAITALRYCTMIWTISLSEGRLPNVSYNPVRVGSDVSKVFDVLNALGIIAFAFRGHNLILEIQLYLFHFKMLMANKNKSLPKPMLTIKENAVNSLKTMKRKK